MLPVCDVGASGDQLKQKLDSISDSVSDNVRDRGTLLLPPLFLLFVTHTDVVTSVSRAFNGCVRMCMYVCILTHKPLDLSSPNLADG